LRRDRVRERAKEMHKEGLTQKQIAEKLNLTQGRVSQIMREKA
jgi:predicted transcriptional regulator